MMTRPIEPLWWSLFSAGGMISAMLLPVLVAITGLLIPFGLVSGDALAYERVYGFLSHPLVRLALFPIIALPLFHWAHRFLYTLVELGLRRHRETLSVACYGSALIGSLLTGYVLWQL